MKSISVFFIYTLLFSQIWVSTLSYTYMILNDNYEIELSEIEFENDKKEIKDKIIVNQNNSKINLFCISLNLNFYEKNKMITPIYLEINLPPPESVFLL